MMYSENKCIELEKKFNDLKNKYITLENKTNDLEIFIMFTISMYTIYYILYYFFINYNIMDVIYIILFLFCNYSIYILVVMMFEFTKTLNKINTYI